MTTKIKSDYKPSERVYELLKAYGVQNPVEFVGHELGAFFLYWEGTGKTKANWDSTCLNWMKRTYEDKKHQTALNRSPSDNKGDVFGKVLDNMQLPLQPIKTLGKVKVRITEVNHLQPPDLGTMSFEDAFAELRNSGVIK